MDLMDKVRQVGENYELNKYKALNKTIELDASLANERLFATKLRLNQVSSMNDKLSKQLRLLQQQYRSQEQKLLLTETMLRQIIESRESSKSNSVGVGVGVGTINTHQHHKQLQAIAAATSKKQLASSGARLAKLRAKKSASIASVQQQQADKRAEKELSRETTTGSNVNCNNQTTSSSSQLQAAIGSGAGLAAQPFGPSGGTKGAELMSSSKTEKSQQLLGAIDTTTTTKQLQQVGAGSSLAGKPADTRKARQVNSSSTQTQTSRTKMIINDLRQRLNLVGSKSKGLKDNSASKSNNQTSQLSSQLEESAQLDRPHDRHQQADNSRADNNDDASAVAVSQANMAIQTDSCLEEEDDDDEFEFEGEDYADQLEDGNNNDGFYRDYYCYGRNSQEAGFSSDGELLIEKKKHHKYASSVLVDNNDYDAGAGGNYFKSAKRLSKQRSISLNEILSNSFVHESATGERIIVSRGWPTMNDRAHGRSGRHHRARQHHSGRSHHHQNGKHHHGEHYDGKSLLATGVRVVKQQRSGQQRLSLNEEQKRHLLMEFLQRNQAKTYIQEVKLADDEAGSRGRGGGRSPLPPPLSNDIEVESAMNMRLHSHHGESSASKRLILTPTSPIHLPKELLGAPVLVAQNRGAPGSLLQASGLSEQLHGQFADNKNYYLSAEQISRNNKQGKARQEQWEDGKRLAGNKTIRPAPPPTGEINSNNNVIRQHGTISGNKKPMIVQYDLPSYPASAGPIALVSGNSNH